MNTVQYKCPNCGAELTFDPEHQNFSCEYCDSTYTEAEMQQLYQNMEQQADQQADASAETLESETDDKAFENETRLYTCQNCGAQIIAEAETSATFCYYCHTPVVLAGRLTGEYKPAYVLPFAVTGSSCGKIPQLVQKALVSPQKLHLGKAAGKNVRCLCTVLAHQL